MFPTNVCFEKYNLKDRSPTLFKIWWAKLTPPMPALALNMHTIWSDHRKFWNFEIWNFEILLKLRVYKDTLKKFDVRKSQVNGAIW